jgi:hypothetical protein
MGLATLNVWIRDRKEPCNISEEPDWQVAIVDCHRRLVKWCDIPNPAPTRCGQAEIRLPPGCYIVFGVKAWDIIGHGEFYGRDVTNATFVSISCDDTACIQLYTSEEMMCWPKVFC